MRIYQADWLPGVNQLQQLSGENCCQFGLEHQTNSGFLSQPVPLHLKNDKVSLTDRTVNLTTLWSWCGNQCRFDALLTPSDQKSQKPKLILRERRVDGDQITCPTAGKFCRNLQSDQQILPLLGQADGEGEGTTVEEMAEREKMSAEVVDGHVEAIHEKRESAERCATEPSSLT